MVRGAGRPEEGDRLDTSNSHMEQGGFGRMPFRSNGEAARAAVIAGSPYFFPCFLLAADGRPYPETDG
jgi:hypothetical protein